MRPRTTTEKQDREFLALRRQGWTCREIGQEHDIPTATIYGSIARARLAETPAGPQVPCPRLVPLWPIDSLTPASPCPHHGPIRRDSVFFCVVCHQSGQDHHPALKRTPGTDPRPEPKPAPPVEPRRTRRQRRSLAERITPSTN